MLVYGRNVAEEFLKKNEKFIYRLVFMMKI